MRRAPVVDLTKQSVLVGWLGWVSDVEDWEELVENKVGKEGFLPINYIPSTPQLGLSRAKKRQGPGKVGCREVGGSVEREKPGRG